MNEGILLLSIVAAAIPTLVYVGLIYWVDRYEKEPLWLLSAAFLWGALPSIILAYVGNTILSIPFYLLADETTADALVGSLIAPPVEESIKGLALLGIFLLWRDEIDSPLDGIIYGAMVGMGFAMVENVFYFVNVFAEGGLEAWSMNVFLRAVVFGLNHALFTSMTGLGIAVARLSNRTAVKIAAPVLGWSAAVFLHFVHNAAVSFGNAFCFVALLTDWGGVWLTVVIIAWSLVQERRWIVRYLQEEVGRGTLSERQYLLLQSHLRRTRYRLQTLFARGPSAYWRVRHFYHVCSELAYKKHHATLFDDSRTAAQIDVLRSEIATLSPGVD